MQDILSELLNVNVEIEGALRVLKARHSQEALDILSDKAASFDLLLKEYLREVKTEPKHVEQPIEPTEEPETDVAEDKACENIEEAFEDAAFIENHYESELQTAHDEDRLMILEDDVPEVPETEDVPQTPELDDVSEQEEKPAEVIEETPINIPAPVVAIEEKDNTISDLYAKNDYRLEDVLAQKEIKSLASTFTINDKFHFIRGLFCDDRQDFEDTVAHISTFSSLGEAYDYLLNDLGWDIDNEEVKDFITKIANYFNAL